MHARSWTGVILLGLTLAILYPGASSALADEGELILAIEPGWALLAHESKNRHGVGAGASAWYGVSETLWLAAGTGAHYTFLEKGERALYGEALGGVALALDVLRTIPFGEAMIGVVANENAFAPSVRISLGADYLVTKSLSLGVVFRYRPLQESLGGDGFFTISLRLGCRLDL